MDLDAESAFADVGLRLGREMGRRGDEQDEEVGEGGVGIVGWWRWVVI